MEQQGFLTWDEEGGLIVCNEFNVSKQSDAELRQFLEDIDSGKYDHYFSESNPEVR